MTRSIGGRWLSVVACATSNLLGAQSVDTVIVEQRVALMNDVTPAAAKQRALDGAMAEAVRQVVGVRVQSAAMSLSVETADNNASRYVSVVQLDAAGRAVDVVLLSEEWGTARSAELGAQPYYRATYRVVVARETGAAAPDFVVRVTTDKARYEASSPVLARNDEMIATVTASRHARVMLFAIGGDSVFRLVPNRYVGPADAAANRPVELPAADWRDRGLRFRARAKGPAGSRDEVLVAVALTGATAAPEAEAITLLEFQRWLAAVPLDARALGFAPYEVWRR